MVAILTGSAARHRAAWLDAADVAAGQCSTIAGSRRERASAAVEQPWALQHGRTLLGLGQDMPRTPLVIPGHPLQQPAQLPGLSFMRATPSSDLPLSCRWLDPSPRCRFFACAHPWALRVLYVSDPDLVCLIANIDDYL